MPRYTIDVDDDFDKTLTELAAAKGGRKSQVIRDAVASYAFLKRATKERDPGQGERKVSITDQRDQVVKDVQLP